MWKLTYGLKISKEGDQTPIDVGEDEEDKNEEGRVEGGTNMDVDDQSIDKKEQKLEQSVHDIQMSSASPQQVISENTKSFTIKDVSNTTDPNINPLLEEYLKRILIPSIVQAKLCDNPILVSVNEIQKLETMTRWEEVKT